MAAPNLQDGWIAAAAPGLRDTLRDIGLREIKPGVFVLPANDRAKLDAVWERVVMLGDVE